MMSSHLNHLVGLERTADMRRAAEYSRVTAAARARRDPQRERSERSLRARLVIRRSPKLA